MSSKSQVNPFTNHLISRYENYDTLMESTDKIFQDLTKQPSDTIILSPGKFCLPSPAKSGQMTEMSRNHVYIFPNDL